MKYAFYSMLHTYSGITLLLLADGDPAYWPNTKPFEKLIPDVLIKHERKHMIPRLVII